MIIFCVYDITDDGRVFIDSFDYEVDAMTFVEMNETKYHSLAIVEEVLLV